MLSVYAHDLGHIQRLYHAAKMGLLQLADVDAEDFDRLRVLWNAIEKKRHEVTPEEE